MFRKILVANRGEIAIRAFRAAVELGARTVAVYPYEDRYSLHRLKADEAYQIGERGHPVRAYLDVDEIIRVARESGADAIYPGYGFLSENPDLAEKAAAAGITFIGPPAAVLEMAGNKVTAKQHAVSAGVPVLRSTDASDDVDALVAACKNGHVGQQRCIDEGAHAPFRSPDITHAPQDTPHRATQHESDTRYRAHPAAHTERRGSTATSYGRSPAPTPPRALGRAEHLSSPPFVGAASVHLELLPAALRRLQASRRQMNSAPLTLLYLSIYATLFWQRARHASVLPLAKPPKRIRERIPG